MNASPVGVIACLFPASRGSASTSSAWSTTAKSLVYVATFYPFALCFASSRGVAVSNGTLVAVELMIAAVAVPTALARMTLASAALLLLVIANFFALALVQSFTNWSPLPMNLKPIRDLMMPVIYVGLGYGLNNRTAAEKVLLVISVAIVIIGIIEFLFPKMFYAVFDTVGFFASRLNLGQFRVSVLQERPGGIGRTLLPFLGPRRISSIFIEPVALGNFAIIVAAWALAKPASQRRSMICFVMMASVMIILCDARFGSLMIMIMIVTAFTKIWRATWLVSVLPLMAIGLLIGLGWNYDGRLSDNLAGRLALSGGALWSMSTTAWLGFPDALTMDAGYSYLIQQAGIMVSAVLWIVFSRLALAADDQARRFHFNVAIYIVAILCVSGSSLFAIKTSAILWLLLGSVLRQRTLQPTSNPPSSRASMPKTSSLSAAGFAK